MPIPAIRGMAGYDPSDLHWLPRSQIVPDEDLQQMVFPFIEQVLEELQEATIADDHDRSTAVATMRLWKYLRVVVLQDAAAMLAEHPERGDHRLLHLQVFKSQGFLVSIRLVVAFAVFFAFFSFSFLTDLFIFFLFFIKEFASQMKLHLQAQATANPNDTTIEAVLPGVYQRMNMIQTTIAQGRKEVQDGFGKVHDSLKVIEGKVSTAGDDTRQFMATEFARMAVGLSQGVIGTTIRPDLPMGTVLGTEEETEQEEQESPEDLEDWSRAEGHQLQCRAPDTVAEMYHQWKGLGKFNDTPILGGLEACDRRFKTRWRKHFEASTQKFFSRIKILSESIHHQAAIRGTTTGIILQEFEHFFIEKNGSVCGLIDHLTQLGIIVKKGRRSRRP
jgi:hypothetical protein